MMNDTKTLSSLKNGQAAYESVVNKEIHYVYLNEKSNTYHELVFKAHKHNFLHLCGVDYYDPKTSKKYSAKQFYDFLKKDRIAIEGIRKKGYSDQKLQIIGQLKDLTSCASLRIIDKRTVYLNLVFDRAIRSRRKVFGLALENDRRSGCFFPLSLINLQSNPKGDTFDKGHPVQCIYTVESKARVITHLCRTPGFKEYEEINTYPYKGVLQGN